LSQQCKQDEVIVQPHNYVLHDMPLYGLLDKQCMKHWRTKELQ